MHKSRRWEKYNSKNKWKIRFGILTKHTFARVLTHFQQKKFPCFQKNTHPTIFGSIDTSLVIIIYM